MEGVRCECSRYQVCCCRGYSNRPDRFYQYTLEARISFLRHNLYREDYLVLGVLVFVSSVTSIISGARDRLWTSLCKSPDLMLCFGIWYSLEDTQQAERTSLFLAGSTARNNSLPDRTPPRRGIEGRRLRLTRSSHYFSKEQKYIPW